MIKQNKYFSGDSPFDIERVHAMESGFKGYTLDSYHVKVRDGTSIAVDVALPKGLPEGKKITAILHQTRYWRAYNFRIPFKWMIKPPYDPKITKVFTKHGYAFVILDVRGTGASAGTRPYPFSRKEVKDGADIVDWILEQPWSNGNVVTYGNSYSGATAELAASLSHPAIKAITCKHDPWDFYTLLLPGGCFNEQFINYWSTLGKGLDQTKGKALLAFKPVNPWFARIARMAVKGVKPVDPARRDLTLEEAARIHTGNKYPVDYKERVTFRDDEINDAGTLIEDISIYKHKEEIEKLSVPIYSFGSWQDSITADVTIDRFLHFDNPQRALIGDWDHKALHRASPFHGHHQKAGMKREDQIKDWLLFYEDCLSSHPPEGKILHYFTMGEERWKKTTTWPPEGQTHQSWLFSDQNALLPPGTSMGGSGIGKDSYRVDYSAGTGIRNRWYTLLSLPVHYPGRKEEDLKLLTYTSSPLEEEIEITGHPVVSMHASTTHDDGMIVAYLEFIDESGEIHVITEGQLRFMHRKISPGTPPYRITFPYHSYLKKDALPVNPGEIMELEFALYPTSILLERGSRLRIAIGGADKDSFARYPEKGNPTLEIYRDDDHPSQIKLPIMSR
ncbi:CocE/NonD family hydrolase [Candidatus Bathyarchaeota archaeon]|nr:CocE/NonD family hydrolase [Candidatus Bathyarchaeota archaeon]